MSTTKDAAPGINFLSKTVSGQIQSFLSMVTTVGFTTLISVYFVFVYLPKKEANTDKQIEDLRKNSDNMSKSLDALYNICVQPVQTLPRKYPPKKEIVSDEAKKSSDEEPQAIEIQTKKKIPYPRHDLMYKKK